jgi:hypothetical protein
MIQGRISVKPLIEQAEWHRTIVPALKHFLPDISEHPQAIFDALGKYSLVSQEEHSAQLLCRKTEAREQLTVDLAMSTDIFSGKPSPKSVDATLDTMSRATEAMSLDDEPPPIQFGYLHPAEDDANEPDGLDSPLGVRLLLKEWEVGCNPREYVYVDPYNSGQSAPVRAKKGHASVNTGRMSSQSQRPPQILATSTVAPLERMTAPSWEMAASQGALVEMETTAEMMASTQVLPGPYGGRAGKRKKRVGGF